MPAAPALSLPPIKVLPCPRGGHRCGRPPPLCGRVAARLHVCGFSLLCKGGACNNRSHSKSPRRRLATRVSCPTLHCSSLLIHVFGTPRGNIGLLCVCLSERLSVSIVAADLPCPFTFFFWRGRRGRNVGRKRWFRNWPGVRGGARACAQKEEPQEPGGARVQTIRAATTAHYLLGIRATFGRKGIRNVNW